MPNNLISFLPSSFACWSCQTRRASYKFEIGIHIFEAHFHSRCLEKKWNCTSPCFSTPITDNSTFSHCAISLIRKEKKNWGATVLTLWLNFYALNFAGSSAGGRGEPEKWNWSYTLWGVRTPDWTFSNCRINGLTFLSYISLYFEALKLWNVRSGSAGQSGLRSRLPGRLTKIRWWWWLWRRW